MTPLWVSLIAGGIAVAGTLLGALVQAWVGGLARRETRAADQRAEALAAMVALLAAVADHRRSRWVREDLRLSHADEQAIREARTATHVTRSAITAPLATVSILLPQLAEQAEATVQAAYAMRDTADHEQLEAMRAASVAAEKQLRQAASGVFGPGCRGGA